MVKFRFLLVFPCAINLPSTKEWIASLIIINGLFLKISSASIFVTLCFLKFLSTLPLSHSNANGLGNLFTNKVYCKNIQMSRMERESGRDYSPTFVTDLLKVMYRAKPPVDRPIPAKVATPIGIAA